MHLADAEIRVGSISMVYCLLTPRERFHARSFLIGQLFRLEFLWMVGIPTKTNFVGSGLTDCILEWTFSCIKID